MVVLKGEPLHPPVDKYIIDGNNHLTIVYLACSKYLEAVNAIALDRRTMSTGTHVRGVILGLVDGGTCTKLTVDHVEVCLFFREREHFQKAFAVFIYLPQNQTPESELDKISRTFTISKKPVSNWLCMCYDKFFTLRDQLKYRRFKLFVMDGKENEPIYKEVDVVDGKELGDYGNTHNSLALFSTISSSVSDFVTTTKGLTAAQYSSVYSSIMPLTTLQVFGQMPKCLVVVWNCIITGCLVDVAIELFKEMPRMDMEHGNYTFTGMLSLASLGLSNYSSGVQFAGNNYAKLESLPLIVELYSSSVPILMYSLLGSSRHLGVGPMSIAFLVMGSMLSEPITYTQDSILYLELAFTATSFAGIFESSMGILRLGIARDFLSKATPDGFIASTSIIMALQELKRLLGSIGDKETCASLVDATVNKESGGNRVQLKLAFKIVLHNHEHNFISEIIFECQKCNAVNVLRRIGR